MQFESMILQVRSTRKTSLTSADAILVEYPLLAGAISGESVLGLTSLELWERFNRLDIKRLLPK